VSQGKKTAKGRFSSVARDTHAPPLGAILMGLGRVLYFVSYILIWVQVFDVMDKQWR